MLTAPVAAGAVFTAAGTERVAPRELRLGAKIALRPIAAGDPVLKFGEPIGTASADIAAGEYVHVHNLRSDYLDHRAAREAAE